MKLVDWSVHVGGLPCGNLCLCVFIIAHVEVAINSISTPPVPPWPRGDSVTFVLALYHGGIDAVELMYCTLYLDARAFTGKRR